MQKIGENLYIGEKIGAGGLGDVYLGKLLRKNEGFEKVVAVKALKENYSENALDALIHEAKITAKLSHPNIANVFDLVVEKGRPYLVMEYIKGTNLKYLIDEARSRNIMIPIEIATTIIYKVASALCFAHNKKKNGVGEIIHRDLTPHNIMLDSNGQIKLLDFGISKVSADGVFTKTEGYKGKIAYIAPEIIAESIYSKESDLYSLGLLFYELLTLRRAFDGENDFSIIEKIKDANFTPISDYRRDIPCEINDLILKLIQKQVSKRKIEDDNLLSILAPYNRPDGKIAEFVSTLSKSQNLEETFIEKKGPTTKRNIKVTVIFISISALLLLLWFSTRTTDFKIIMTQKDGKEFDFTPPLHDQSLLKTVDKYNLDDISCLYFTRKLYTRISNMDQLRKDGTRLDLYNNHCTHYIPYRPIGYMLKNNKFTTYGILNKDSLTEYESNIESTGSFYSTDRLSIGFIPKEHLDNSEHCLIYSDMFYSKKLLDEAPKNFKLLILPKGTGISIAADTMGPIKISETYGVADLYNANGYCYYERVNGELKNLIYWKPRR